jgi:hypothetical protein
LHVTYAHLRHIGWFRYRRRVVLVSKPLRVAVLEDEVLTVLGFSQSHIRQRIASGGACLPRAGIDNAVDPDG